MRIETPKNIGGYDPGHNRPKVGYDPGHGHPKATRRPVLPVCNRSSCIRAVHKGWFLWPAHSGIDKSTTGAARRASHRTYDPSVQRPEGRCDHAGWHAPAAQLGGYPLRSRARAKQEPVLSGLSRGARSGLAGWRSRPLARRRARARDPATLPATWPGAAWHYAHGCPAACVAAASRRLQGVRTQEAFAARPPCCCTCTHTRAAASTVRALNCWLHRAILHSLNFLVK